MKWLKLIISGLCFLLIKGESCENLILQSNTEGKLKDLIEQHYTFIQNQSISCIRHLVLSGNYKALETYTTMLNDDGIKFRETLFNAMASIQSTLKEYDNDNYMKKDIIEAKKVTPVFRWAQSMERVFVQIKFSYSFNFPPCENIDSLLTHIDDLGLSVNCKCVLSDIPVIFNLNLALFKLIDKNNSRLINDQHGCLFDLKKKKKDYWFDLVSPEKKSDYPQISIWYEMKSKYESELREYEKKEEEKSYEEIELELKQQIKIEKERKKKGNKKRKKNKVKTSDL